MGFGFAIHSVPYPWRVSGPGPSPLHRVLTQLTPFARGQPQPMVVGRLVEPVFC